MKLLRKIRCFFEHERMKRSFEPVYSPDSGTCKWCGMTIHNTFERAFVKNVLRDYYNPTHTV